MGKKKAKSFVALLKTLDSMKRKPTKIESRHLKAWKAAISWQRDHEQFAYLQETICEVAHRAIGRLLQNRFADRNRVLTVTAEHEFRRALEDALVESVVTNINHFIPQVAEDDLCTEEEKYQMTR